MKERLCQCNPCTNPYHGYCNYCRKEPKLVGNTLCKECSVKHAQKETIRYLELAKFWRKQARDYAK